MLGPNKKQRSKINSQKLAMRDSLWPHLDKGRLWDWAKSDGWLNIPRAMPLILRIMDAQSKGKPVSGAYLDLWCRTFGDSFVIANKPREMAFFSGFSGERAERTWISRIRSLETLGFIEVAPGPSGPISYIVILNPYLVIKEQRSKKLVDTSLWNALQEKMIEIRANDLNEAEPSPSEAMADAAQAKSTTFDEIAAHLELASAAP